MRTSAILAGMAGTVIALACNPGSVHESGSGLSVAAIRQYQPPEASAVFAAGGELLAHLSHQRRIVVPLADNPALLIDGFVAVEDRRFYRHGGVDLRGFGRAAWRNLRSFSFREGSSTITMQLARNIFPELLPPAKKPGRKLREMRLALMIERELNKQEILELYLNQLYMGGGLYGVEAAARAFFGKPAVELSLDQAALLVGLARSPEHYSPREWPDRALARRNLVLGVMAREGVVSATEAATAQQLPLNLAPVPQTVEPAPYFLDAVRRELRQHFGPDAAQLGLRVFTSLDTELQQAAQAALRSQIERIEAGRFGTYRNERPLAQHLPPSGEDASPFLQGMVVVLNARNGDVLALVGGRDYGHSQFDRAFQARRQPGSAFKPIVFAAAIESGLAVSSRIELDPLVFVGDVVGGWQPVDNIGNSLESISMRRALAVSSNVAAVRVGQHVGEQQVARMARTLGLSTPVPLLPSIFLGAAEVVPVELTAAYATFANGGYRVSPRLIRRVEDSRGRLLWEAPAQTVRVLDEGTAFLVTSLLQEALDSGTGATVRSNGFTLPAAGKTGTTNDVKDAWFIGATQDLSAGVWLGFDRPRTIVAGGSGGSLAAPVWTALMQNAYSNRPPSAPWLPPPQLIALRVDTLTGALAVSGCPAELTRIEYFLPGTELDQICTLHSRWPGATLLQRLLRRLRGGGV